MSMEPAIEYALSEDDSSTIATRTPEHTSSATARTPPALTRREREVARLVARRLTNRQIAEELFVSPRTVDTHLTSIYHKLGVTSRAAATRFALEHGLA